MYGSAGRSIDPDRLAAQLTALPHPFKIEIVPETGSTNTDLMTRLRASKMLEQPIARIPTGKPPGAASVVGGGLRKAVTRCFFSCILHTPPGQYIGWAESGRKRGGSERIARAPADRTAPACAEMAE